MEVLSSTIRELLVKAEASYGSCDAFRYKVKQEDADGKKITVAHKTYTELKQDSERLSAAMEALGEKNTHIAILGATSYEWVVTYMGVVNGGNVAVPLDAQLPADDICDLLTRAEVTTLVFDDSKAQVAAEAIKKCPGLKILITMNQSNPEGDILSFWSLLGKQEPGYAQEPKPEDLATIMFTSGTTGKSKGVMLSHRNLAENATCLDMKIEPGTVILSVLPIHHAYCLSMDILKGLSIGCVICVNDSLMRVAKNIKLFEPNMILMVPLMIETLAKKLEEASFLPAALVKAKVFGKQFHTICSGGAYMNPAYLDTFQKYGITILQGYGMTECSPVISTNLPW
ncbi:MAG: AMP-binding protein, partial [Lachnospiraceae bacterium]